MKFVADAMLGRLARWLRLIGYDVLYDPDIDDRQVLRVAREQQRIILTRDTRLIRSKGIGSHIFITSDNIFDQLRELKCSRIPLQGMGFSRCSFCNTPLEKITHKEQIRDSVPEYVYHTVNEFHRCSVCGKVFWDGTHGDEVRRMIHEILSDPPGAERPGSQN